MPGKRQHYVPDFMLRRFAIDPSVKIKRIHRLDKATGKPQVRATINEAVIGRYYEFKLDDGTAVKEADKALDIIENLAAAVLGRLDDVDYLGTYEDRLITMIFVASLHRRTPQAREALRELSERSAEVFLEMKVSDKDAFHRATGSDGRTHDAIEEARQSLLRLLRGDQVRAKATADHEIPLMFIGLEETVNAMLGNLGVTCIRLPAGSKRSFVASDHPVAQFDPHAPSPDIGIGFLSSPAATTWIALDPKFGLLLTPDRPESWQNAEAADDDIDELNLLTYAWARDAIYGNSQQAITETRRFAKTHKSRLGEFAYRPQRLWISKQGNSDGGPTTFQNRYRGKTVERTITLRGDVRRAA